MLLMPKAKAVSNLTTDEYDKLRRIFTSARIASMSEDEAERYLSYDLENSKKVVKYYKIIENNNNTTQVEVSDEEAAILESGIRPYDAGVATNYKRMQVTRTKITGNKYLIILDSQWDVTPKVKSYDVLALRGFDAEYIDGSQSGTQTFWTNESQTYEHVNYSSNGTNIVKKDLGFGISMNLVDAASYFECEIEGIFVATSQFAKIYGAYQHAIAYVSLAQSQNYNISHNGYGKVINFSSSVAQYYDGMQGVDISLDYT